MDRKDIEKLNILLPHWIEHNDSHLKAYLEWADRLSGEQWAATAGHIREASDAIARANESFRAAAAAFKDAAGIG